VGNTYKLIFMDKTTIISY